MGETTIGSMSQGHPDVTRPLYSFAEADRLAKVTPNTSRRWLKGYHYWYSSTERRTLPPITRRSEPIEEAVSFLDLMEVAAISKLISKGFRLPIIRKINEVCRFYLHTSRPLVTEKFKVAGRDIFIDEGFGILVNVRYEAGMQAWEEILRPFLEDVDYENEFVRRWWPLGKDHRVVVDPDYGFGLPVIAGTGVRTEIIAERSRAGDSEDEIVYDFGVNPEQIHDALRYEGEAA